MAVEYSGVNQRFIYLFDGTTPTPFYVKLFQVDQPTIPMMEPRAESEIQLDGGRISAFIATYITDEAAPFRGVPISFRVGFMSEYMDLLRAFGNMFRDTTWTIGGDTWTGVTEANLGTRKDSAGVDQPCIAPKDAVQKDFMVNVVVENLVPTTGAPTGSAQYTELRGLVISESSQLIENNIAYVDVNGMIYGSINPRLVALPTGNESTPS